MSARSTLVQAVAVLAWNCALYRLQHPQTLDQQPQINVHNTLANGKFYQ